MHLRQHRLLYLDGLRGIAVSMVLATHFWGGGWVDAFLPYGGAFRHNVVARYGWAGVEMFFLISGYVILKTLERCRGFTDFIFRRWLRLFPAMLIATILTVTYAHTFQPITFYQHPSFVDTLPGLTFLPDALFHTVTRLPVHPLNRAFWTLFVETSFYIIFGLAFFWWGWVRAVILLFWLGALGVALNPVLAVTHASAFVRWLFSPYEWFGAYYYWWFVSGILFAKAAEENRRLLFWLALSIGVLASMVLLPNPEAGWSDRAAMLVIVGVFATAQRARPLQALLEQRVILFVGLVSYPLYLLHEAIGLGLIVLVQRFLPWVPMAALPLLPTAGLILTAYLVEAYGEKWVRAAIIRLAAGHSFRSGSDRSHGAHSA